MDYKEWTQLSKAQQQLEVSQLLHNHQFNQLKQVLLEYYRFDSTKGSGVDLAMNALRHTFFMEGLMAVFNFVEDAANDVSPTGD